MDKAEFRKNMADRRASILPDKRKKQDGIILAKVLESKPYKETDKLLCYINMGTEVGTKGLITKALDEGKIVAVPFAVPKSREMFFIQISSLDGLTRSKYGALEPACDERKIIDCTDGTLLIVPGLAYDMSGYRIGYGGGYYDTYIANNPGGYNLGVAYSQMLVESVPRQEHDRKLDGLITEKEVLQWKN